MKQKDLADALGLTPGQVSRLVKRGMPTDDVERARRWRRRHLEAARTSEERPDYRAQRVQRTLEDLDMPAERTRLVALCDSAKLALSGSGMLPAQLEDALRAELQQVPLAERADVVLPQEVWLALTADVRRLLDECVGQLEPGARAAYEQEASDESAANRAWQSNFAYQVAAGEIRVASQPMLDLQ